MTDEIRFRQECIDKLNWCMHTLNKYNGDKREKDYYSIASLIHLNHNELQKFTDKFCEEIELLILGFPL